MTTRSVMTQKCACGHTRRAPYERRFLAALRRWRAPDPVVLCAMCDHEIEPIRRAHDVRKLAASANGDLVHAACVNACPEAVALRVAAQDFSGKHEVMDYADRAGMRRNKRLLKAAVAYAVALGYKPRKRVGKEPAR